jgi:type II secretion system protein G
MRTVLVLLPIVMVSSHTDRCRIAATEATLKQLARGVADFQKTCARLPTPAEGLDVLIHKPADWPEEVAWTPYLEIPEVPRDAWNNEFTYIRDPELAKGFGIYSCGQDGVSSSNGNDRDDLNTWSKGSPWLAYYRSPWRRENLRSTITMLIAIILLVVASGLLIWGVVQVTIRAGAVKDRVNL